MRLRTRVPEVAARHGYRTQRQLAGLLNLSEATISLIAHGRREVGERYQAAALKALGKYGYGWADLFWYEPTAEPEPERAEVAV